jgi:ABC-type branched-subunit amino acid transport system substrate-binding protein
MTDTPPAHIRVLSNGAWYDNVTHRITKGGGIPTTGIQRGDSNRAREMNAIRREKAARRSRQEIVERAMRAKDDGIQLAAPAAVGYLAGEAYASALANMMDKPREAVDAGKFALKLADMAPQEDRQSGPIAAVQIIMAPEAKEFVEGLWTEEEA